MTHLQVLLPSGKTGWIPATAGLPLVTGQELVNRLLDHHARLGGAAAGLAAFGVPAVNVLGANEALQVGCIGTGGRCRNRDGVALLAGRAVGEIAHRIDRLVGRTRGNEHVPTGEHQSGRREQRFDRRDDLHRLGHPAEPGLARFTLLLVQDWFASSLQDSWWGSQAALWLVMTLVTVAGILWAVVAVGLADVSANAHGVAPEGATRPLVRTSTEADDGMRSACAAMSSTMSCF